MNASLNFCISSSVQSGSLFLVCLLSLAFLSRFLFVFTIAVGSSIFCSDSSSSATITCCGSSSLASITCSGPISSATMICSGWSSSATIICSGSFSSATIICSSSFFWSLLLYPSISCSPSSYYFSTYIFCIQGSTLTILRSSVIGENFFILGPYTNGGCYIKLCSLSCWIIWLRLSECYRIKGLTVFIYLEIAS